jgi:hypothetical protein
VPARRMEKSRACLSCVIFVNLSEDFIQMTHNKVKNKTGKRCSNVNA